MIADHPFCLVTDGSSALSCGSILLVAGAGHEARPLNGLLTPLESACVTVGADAGLHALGRGRYDLVLVDHDLADHTAPDFIRLLRERLPRLPVVATACTDLAAAVACLRAGAADILGDPLDAEELHDVAARARFAPGAANEWPRGRRILTKYAVFS